MICNNCTARTSFTSSNKTEIDYFENNIRLVYAFRSIGKGQLAAHTFCSVMNLPQSPPKFAQYNKYCQEPLQK